MATINRYAGNSGRVTRVPGAPSAPRQQRANTPVAAEQRQERRPAGGLSALFGEGAGKLFSGDGGLVGGVLGKLRGLADMETEDLLLVLVLYLLYRESGDKELLIILAAMLLM